MPLFQRKPLYVYLAKGDKEHREYQDGLYDTYELKGRFFVELAERERHPSKIQAYPQQNGDC